MIPSSVCFALAAAKPLLDLIVPPRPTSHAPSPVSLAYCYCAPIPSSVKTHNRLDNPGHRQYPRLLRARMADLQWLGRLLGVNPFLADTRYILTVQRRILGRLVGRNEAGPVGRSLCRMRVRGGTPDSQSIRMIEPRLLGTSLFPQSSQP